MDFLHILNYHYDYIHNGSIYFHAVFVEIYHELFNLTETKRNVFYGKICVKHFKRDFKIRNLNRK